MRRAEFLRRVIAGAVGIALAPALTFEPEDVAIEENIIPVVKGVYKFHFKVSNEAIKDQDTFNTMFAELKANNPCVAGIDPVKVEVGVDGDDFAKDMHTVLLTYDRHRCFEDVALWHGKI